MSMRNKLLGLVCGLASACTLGGLDDLTRGDRDAAVLENGKRDAGPGSPEASTTGDASVAGKDAGPELTGELGKDAQAAQPEPDARVELPAPDAGAPAPDAALPDAATPTPDAGSPDSGPVKVPPTGGLVSNAGPCTGMPDNVHCDDFDTGALGDNHVGLRAGWGFEEEDLPFRPTALDLVDDGPEHPGSRSLQSSLGSAVPAQDTARLIDWLPGPPSAVTIDFDFKPSWTFVGPAPNLLRWIRIQQLAGNDNYPGIGLDARPDGIFMNYDNYTVAGGLVRDGALIADIFEGWRHITLEVHFGAHASVRVSFDGSLIYEKQDFVLMSEDIKESYVCFGMYSEGAAPSTALYDNVVVSYTP
jgi:hypothetical protein